jgi:Phage capsid family
MSKRLIERLRADRDEIRTTADTVLAKADADGKLSADDQANLDSLLAEATALDTRIGSLVQTEMARIEQDRIEAQFDLARHERATGQSDTQDNTSLAEQFVRSDMFAAYAANPSGSSARFEAKTSAFGLIGSVDANDNPLAPRSRVRDAALPSYPIPLLNAIGYEPVGSNAIEWIEWPADVPLAGTVAEGAEKPEATYSPVLREGTLDTYAHHIPLTRQALQDIPRVQAVVQNALLRGVWLKAEAAAAAALVAATFPTATHDSLLEAIRVGLAQNQSDGWATDAVVLNPFDYAEIDIDLLTKTLNGARAESPVWGLRVIPAAAVAPGTAYVGDLKSGMTLFDRNVTSIYMTDSHASEFTSNIIRLLGEGRMKTVVDRPEAIVECTVAP